MFVPYFLIGLGVLLLFFGGFLLFGSEKSIEKYIKWMFSFSTAKPKNNLKGRPIKTLRANGIMVLLLGIFLVGFGYWLMVQLTALVR